MYNLLSINKPASYFRIDRDHQKQQPINLQMVFYQGNQKVHIVL